MQILRSCVRALFSISGGIAATGFGLLAILVVLDVFLRNFGLAKWPWLNELTEYLLTISTFGGAPWVLHQAAHVNVDIVLRVVPRWARVLLMRSAHIVGLAISVVVTWLAVTAALDSASSGATVFKNIKFPEWWMMVPVIWCFAVCSLEFFMRAMQGGKQ